MKTQKKRHSFKVLAVLLVLATVLSGTVSVYAVNIPPGAEDVAPAQVGDREKAEAVPLTRAASYFLYGESSIEYAGNHVMSVMVTTLATTTITKVKSVAMLEQYKGGQWQLVDLYQQDEKNSPVSEACMARTVPVGYYYRAHGIHITVHAGTNTRKETITGILWLDK